MNELRSIVLACCGFGGICCGAFFFAMLMLFRLTGRSMLLPALTALNSVLFHDRHDEKMERQFSREIAKRSRPDGVSSIKNRVQAADKSFNQALGDQGLPPDRPLGSGRFGGQDSSGIFDDDVPSLRRRRRDGRSRDEEYLGSHDDDDDGFLDF